MGRSLVGVLTALAVTLLLAAPPASANGVTFPIASGVSDPYEYEVRAGAFSPLRRALLVAVTLLVEGQPVLDADVRFTVSVDDSPASVGPLTAANMPIHIATYEVSLDLPEIARDKVSITIDVDSAHGPSVIEAEMIVPEVVEPFDLGGSAVSESPWRSWVEGHREAIIGGFVGILALGLGVWSVGRYRRPRSTTGR